jgi:hypothetical protein
MSPPDTDPRAPAPTGSPPSLEALIAAAPLSMSLAQIAQLAAAGVCEAYSAYNNGNNLAPSLPGYQTVQSVMVYEVDPNVNPFEGDATAGAKTFRPIAYAPGDGAANPCSGPKPYGTPSIGNQLFGFTAVANDNSHNILMFRGTVTPEEAGYDLLGWGDNCPCNLPSQSASQQAYGNVNSKLYDFYTQEGTFGEASLAANTIAAIQATNAQNPNAPWILGGHSLGGAMISLAALDGTVSGLFGEYGPIVFTYGSLHVGDLSFANAYMAKAPASGRIANLCDFVPSMVSLEPGQLDVPYEHVGFPGVFTWQTWSDWDNHSLADIYQPIVQAYWPLIKWTPQTYPQ